MQGVSECSHTLAGLEMVRGQSVWSRGIKIITRKSKHLSQPSKGIPTCPISSHNHSVTLSSPIPPPSPISTPSSQAHFALQAYTCLSTPGSCPQTPYPASNCPNREYVSQTREKSTSIPISHRPQSPPGDYEASLQKDLCTRDRGNRLGENRHSVRSICCACLARSSCRSRRGGGLRVGLVWDASRGAGRPSLRCWGE